MDLLATARATLNGDFQSRVRAALVVTALDIVNSDLPQGHPRDAAAMEVLVNPDTNPHFTRFLWIAAANTAIAASVTPSGSVGATDADIQYVVAGVWSLLYPDPPAGVPATA